MREVHASVYPGGSMRRAVTEGYNLRPNTTLTTQGVGEY